MRFHKADLVVEKRLDDYDYNTLYFCLGYNVYAFTRVLWIRFEEDVFLIYFYILYKNPI